MFYNILIEIFITQ